nr:basic proline-rich protein-like [Chlorocebus sabaeus]
MACKRARSWRPVPSISPAVPTVVAPGRASPHSGTSEIAASPGLSSSGSPSPAPGARETFPPNAKLILPDASGSPNCTSSVGRCHVTRPQRPGHAPEARHAHRVRPHAPACPGGSRHPPFPGFPHLTATSPSALAAGSPPRPGTPPPFPPGPPAVRSAPEASASRGLGPLPPSPQLLPVPGPGGHRPKGEGSLLRPAQPRERLEPASCSCGPEGAAHPAEWVKRGTLENKAG